MTTPVWVEALNVNFNGTLSPSVKLADDGDVTLLLWDPLSADAKSVVQSLMAEYTSALTLPTQGSQTVNVGGAKTGASSTGLANDGTVYTTTVRINGGTAQPISVVGSTAQTYTTLIAQIQADLTGATVAIVGGNIRITSNTVGEFSSVAITGGNLFSTLTDFSAVAAAVAGTSSSFAAAPGNAVADFNGTVVGGNATGLSNAGTTASTQTINFGGAVVGGNATGLANTSRVYRASVILQGTPVAITVTGSAAQTFTALVAQINADLGSAATAAISGGNIVITSAVSGTGSSVDVRDTGLLFDSCTGFVRVNPAVLGTSPVVYTATAMVNGTPIAISVNGNAAQTFTALVAQINADLGSAATAAISGGNIVITSATTGVTSTIKLTDRSLFKSCNGFDALDNTHPGVGTLLDVFTFNKAPNGMSVYDYVSAFVRVVGNKPATSGAARRVSMYFNGTTWLYYATDAAVGSVPPLA